MVHGPWTIWLATLGRPQESSCPELQIRCRLLSVNGLKSPEASTLNLNVLRRINPDIKQVLACANHVALYDFDRSQHRWVRKEVEGSFFLIEKTLSPFHQIIILNKKNADNFVEDVVPDLGFELTLPYIMYRNRTDEVIGVWFYEEEEAKKVALLLHQITENYRAAGVTAIKTFGCGQVEQRQPAVIATAAIPATNISLEDKATQPDQEAGFWDKPIKQPASGIQGALLVDRRRPTHENASEKLFANVKVPDSFSIPTSSPMPLVSLQSASAANRSDTEAIQALDTGATSLGDERGSSKAAPPPHAPRPALLTPKFLANAKVQLKSHAASSKLAELQPTVQQLETSGALLDPEMPMEQDDTSLLRFFAAGSRSTSTQGAGPPLGARDRLRRAITALSQSDAFIDALAKELESAGLLH